jgi:hypothetical protein
MALHALKKLSHLFKNEKELRDVLLEIECDTKGRDL